MRVLVVDDEPLARDRLLRMLEGIPGVVAVGEAANGREALEQIEAREPDVVLLDVRMPGLDGLQVARAAPEAAIVFTTAHDEYAVEAFELSAVDYLMKPVRRERLVRALERARGAAGPPAAQRIEEALTRLVEASGAARVRLTARRGSTLRVFDCNEIVRFTATGGYTSFTHGGEEFLLDESLAELEERLGPVGFVRIHRAELVQLDAVRALHSDDAGTTVELRDGQRAHVSRRSVPDLKRRLGVE